MSENYYADFSGAQLNQPELETKPASQEAANAVAQALAFIAGRSFSQRNPELGKMIKCQFCGRRHRQVQALYTHSETDGVKKASKLVGYVTCAQQFKELHIEEDLETGEKTTVYAVVARNTRKGIVGAATFKGKRLKSHPNQNNLRFIERVRKLFGEGNFDENSKEHKAALELARKTATRQLWREKRQRANRHRHQQDVSRRINRGLAAPGSR